MEEEKADALEVAKEEIEKGKEEEKADASLG